MANIADPWALDVTGPTSNSNFAGTNLAEGCAPSGINNALRQLGAFLAQATSYQSAAMSSSVSTNIAATGTGVYIPITGANVINSFGVVSGQQPSAAVIRILEFSSSASLSHGPSLNLVGGAAIRSQPGDVMGFIHEGSSDVWRQWLYSPASGNPLPSSISQTTLAVGSISASMGRFSHMAAQSESVSSANMTSISASIGAFGNLKVAGVNVTGPMYIISDDKTSGTNGGSITSGAFRTRTLNTERLDQIGITTAANVMALPAGTYICNYLTACGPCDNWTSRLRDTTNSVTLIVGTTSDTSAALDMNVSAGYGSFTLAGAANVELQVQVTTTGATAGGVAASFQTETYSLVWLTKVA